MQAELDKWFEANGDYADKVYARHAKFQSSRRYYSEAEVRALLSRFTLCEKEPAHYQYRVTNDFGQKVVTCNPAALTQAHCEVQPLYAPADMGKPAVQSKPSWYGEDQPWPLHDVLVWLVKASKILLDEKDYDRTGHENMKRAQIRGEEILLALGHAADIGKPASKQFRPLTQGHCAAGRDGDCIHPDCPQNRDNEPEKSGRSCPLAVCPDCGVWGCSRDENCTPADIGKEGGE